VGNELVQSLIRGLDALELAARSEQGLCLAEMAEHLGVKPPTAFNIARTLAAKGYLEKSTRPIRYRLGPAAVELAAARERRLWFRHAVDTVRTVFTSLENATVVLGEPVGGEILVSLRMDPARPQALERFPNWPMAPYATAVALCFQAFWSGPERGAYRGRHPFAECGIVHWHTEAALDAFLDEARSRGVLAVTTSDPLRVAAPVYGSGQRLIAGLGASLTQVDAGDTMSQRQLTEVVTTAARRLSDSAACVGTGTV